jgi:threonine synthase
MNKEFMESLQETGIYHITKEMKEQLESYSGGYASEAQTAETIKNLYEKTGYVIDTHTAVAASVYNRYVEETGDQTKTVIASTASPFKFGRSVLNAIDSKYDALSDFEQIDELAIIANVEIPNAINEIRNAPVLHDHICEKDAMVDEVKKFLGI